jgi:hypothetical protein
MDLNTIMKNHGFGASSSGGGCMWYTKQIAYQGKDAIVAITDDGGLGLPESLEEPVYVGIYDLDSGDELVEAELVNSLKSYLDSPNSQ